MGLIAILLSGIGCAAFIVSELDARARNVKALCKMLKLIKRMVESFSMSLRDILREMPEGLAEDCGFDRECDAVSLVSFVEACSISDSEARAIFTEFAHSFGKNYRDGQVRECAYYIERMEERERLLLQKLPSQKKLVYAVSLCLALTLVILLL